MNRDRIRRLVFLSLLIVAAPAVAQEYEARLGRMPVDSRNQSTIAGIGKATAELDGNRLVINGKFAELLGAATTANLHMGVAVGARGPMIHELAVSAATEGELTGRIELNDAQLAALRAGRLYIQINSQIAPDGNLWGWLLSE